jgi:hypothetical protein
MLHAVCYGKRNVFPMKTWGSGGIAPPFFISELDGGEGQLHAPAVLGSRKEIPVSIVVGPQKLVRREKLLALSGIEPQILCRPARRPSLYLLRYSQSGVYYVRS